MLAPVHMDMHMHVHVHVHVHVRMELHSFKRPAGQHTPWNSLALHHRTAGRPPTRRRACSRRARRRRGRGRDRPRPAQRRPAGGLGSFSERAGQPDGAGQGADLRGARQMLHRSISSHLSLARGAVPRGGGGLRWTDRCVAPDGLAAPVRQPQAAGARARQQQVPAQAADCRQQPGRQRRPAATAPGSLEDMRWSPSGQRMGRAASLPAPTPSKELSSAKRRPLRPRRLRRDRQGRARRAVRPARARPQPGGAAGVMAKLDTDGNGSVCFDGSCGGGAGAQRGRAARRDGAGEAAPGGRRRRGQAAAGAERRRRTRPSSRSSAPSTATATARLMSRLSAALRELGLNLNGVSTKGISQGTAATLAQPRRRRVHPARARAPRGRGAARQQHGQGECHPERA